MRFQKKWILTTVLISMTTILFSSVLLRTTDAQLIRNRAPLQRTGSSFNERIGVGFGFNFRGSKNFRGIDRNGNFIPNGDIQFRQGGAGAAVPNVGGFNPNAAGRTGFALIGKNGEAFFNLTAGQGSRRSSGLRSPSVTTLNGRPGFFSAGSQRPFVTSVIPVVGDRRIPLQRSAGRSVLNERISRLRASAEATQTPKIKKIENKSIDPPSGIASRIQKAQRSTAGQAEMSLAEIAKQQKLEGEEVQLKAAKYLEKAIAAQQQGKTSVAKNYLRIALRTAKGDLRQSILEQLSEISHRSSSKRSK